MSTFAFALLLTACPKPEAPPPVVDACTQGLRPTRARLLTRFELDNTLRDLVRDPTRPGLSGLPPEPLALGLDNNADVHTVTVDYQARLFDLAESVAARAVRERRAELVPCAGDDAACGHAFVEGFLARAFRRAPATEELTTFAELFDVIHAAEGFDAGVEAVITAALLSPQLLYRLEPFATAAAVEALSGPALASRLSYFLWGTMPDDALRVAGETGALADPAVFDAQVARLLADPRAAEPASHFFSLYLGFEGIAGLEKDPVRYPAFSADMRTAWQRSLELYLDDVFTRDRSLSSLLTSGVLYVDENMGGMYGNGPVPAGQFIRLEMPLTKRSGVLTQPGFLARLSAPDQSSPIRRGVFVLEKVMCEVVAPPPPEVAAVPPPFDPSLTTRERFAVHSSTKGCSGCHVRIDGIGFGFEHYDGIGAWRDTDNGKPVDATGEVAYVTEASLEGPFDGATALLDRLSTSRQVHDCMATHWYRYAAGRVESQGDRCSVEGVQAAFFESGGRFDALREAVVESPAFRVHAQEVSP